MPKKTNAAKHPRVTKTNSVTVNPSFGVSAEHDDHPINVSEYKKLKKMPIPRPRKFGDEETVSVTLDLTYPLTDAVPVRMSHRTFKAKTVWDVCKKIRSMYEKIYEKDEELGGKTAAQSKKEDPRRRLDNRGFGPLIWGHDIGDLVVEVLTFTWVSPTECYVDVFVGS
jgi:hypothetical protein